MGKKKIEPKLNPIEKFKKVARKYLRLDECHEYIDVIFGTIFGNRLDSDPMWVYIIGPASIGKTIVLEATRAHESIVFRSTVTPAGLISSFDKRKKKNKRPLLELLNGKMLIIKDFTTMLNMRHDVLVEILGLLRDIYDGEIDKEFAEESISHESTFGIIAAVTNAIDKHLILLSDLGERFLSYRMPMISLMEETQRCMDALEERPKSEMKMALREAAHELLDTKPEIPTMTKRQKKDIIESAIIVAKARCHVTRDRYSKDPEEAQREVAVRITKQLGNLSKGIAMAKGKKEVGSDEILLAKKAAMYTLPLRRIKLLKMLLVSKHGLTVEQLRQKMGLSDKGARIHLDDLVLVGLARKEESITDSRGGIMRWKLIEKLTLERLMKGVVVEN